MKLKNALPQSRPLIEPLEQRIAPALLVSGANLLGGKGNPTTGQTSINGNSVTLVTVESGVAIVWFDGNNIAAISVGPNTALNIVGDVGYWSSSGTLYGGGDIVGNLNASGQLSNSSLNASNGLNGDVLLPDNILGITTHPLGGELGSVANIITGGSVTNVNVSGNLQGIYAGNGAFYTGNTNALLDSHVLSGGQVVVGTAGVDVNPIQPGVQGGFVFSSSNARTVASGASITNVKVGAAEEMQLFAGDGFSSGANTPGLPGGSVTHITIVSAFVDTNNAGVVANTPSYFIKAGMGGPGKSGGAGGNISGISEVTSTGIVYMIAGAGGPGSSGAGGAGGSISSLNMLSNGTAYTVTAGNGGNGVPGGPGGSVKGVNFGQDQLSNGIVVAAPFTGGPNDDLLLVDAQTGNMVIEENNLNTPGAPAGFTAVIQDSNTNQIVIAPNGSTPVAATAMDIGGVWDFAVAYKNSQNVGIYSNQGGGVFYTVTPTSENLMATSLSLPTTPVGIAAGNFSGGLEPDLAVLLNNQGQSEVLSLLDNGQGAFTASNTLVQLPGPATSMVAADNGGVYDLFVAMQSGDIEALTPQGTTFNPVVSGVTVPGGILNMDYFDGTPDGTNNLLLALNSAGSVVTVFDVQPTGLLSQASLIAMPGVAAEALFVPLAGTSGEPIDVLISNGSGARLDTFTFASTAYVLTSSVQSSESLRNFAVLYEQTETGVAALGTSVEHFAFSQNGAPFYDVSLPFAGKTVHLTAGNGGDGLMSTTAGGGAGGAVTGFSIQASQIFVTAGNGGSSNNAPAGAGGAVTDTPSFITYTGQGVAGVAQSDSKLIITAGTGGLANGTSAHASGGAGGSAAGLDLSILGGNIVVNGGDGNNGGGGAGGAGGAILGLKAVDNGGDLDLTSGYGGNATGAAGNGGAGGSIMNLTYSLSLGDQTAEVGYYVNVLAEYGGTSAAGFGGAGGAVSNLNLTLQPPNESFDNPDAAIATVHANLDSTLRVTVAAGDAGNGATGGVGGMVSNVKLTALYDQLITIVGATAAQSYSFIEINPVVAMFTSGHGGAGSKGAGGAGGMITGLNLIGVSHYDPDSKDPQAGDTPLVITAGYGGNGATTGGAGGAVENVSAINANFETSLTITGSTGVATSTTQPRQVAGTELAGAQVTSGSGGSGGSGNGAAGGTVSNVNIGVSGFTQESPVVYSASYTTQNPILPDAITEGGQMIIQTGDGGNGGGSAKGGAGGMLVNSVLGCVNAFEDYGLWLQSGAGGSAGTGGAGGSITNMQINSPENAIPAAASATYDVLSTLIIAGNGGGNVNGQPALTVTGGVGGSISHITESKDVNTPINVIQAGNGGNANTTGGLGGSVTNVYTVGLIGQASDDNGNSFGAFQTNTAPIVFNAEFPYGSVPEGVFAGRGGTGTTAGLAGSVTSITAAQIAAIGAAVDSNGLFAAAEKVAGITAEIIGYGMGGSTYQNMNSTGNSQNPSVAVPVTGFLYSVTQPTGISEALTDPTLLDAFTFAPANPI